MCSKTYSKKRSAAACQIFQIESCKDKYRVESVASGVFVSLPIKGMKNCLITAAHVLDCLNLSIASSASYDDNPQYNYLSGTPYSSKENDWAVFSLSDEFAKDIVESGKIFINFSLAKTCSPYTFCGFPSSKNKSKNSYVKCQPYSHTGDEISIEKYKQLKLDFANFIAIDFHRGDTVNVKTGDRMDFPEPYGMSGGPIFDNNDDFCGIVTNYDRKNNVLYGVRFLTIFSDLILQLKNEE